MPVTAPHMPVTARSAVSPGQAVWLVQKQDQATGRLTRGVVASLLTSSARHPRGIKVRTVDGTVGRVQRVAGKDEEEEEEEGEGYPSWADPSPVAPASASSAPPAPPPPSHDDWPSLGEARKPPPPQSSWACPRCTFVNSSLLPRCEMCDGE